jgi:hypothetical protein
MPPSGVLLHRSIAVVGISSRAGIAAGRLAPDVS